MQRLIAIALIVFLAGCADMRLQDADLSPTNKVAVVSLLGDTVHGLLLGVMVFQNESFDAQVPDWKIDAVAEETIQSHLAQSASRNIVMLQHDSGLSKRFTDSWSLLHDGNSYDEVLSLAKAKQADILVLVEPVNYQNTPQFKKGYGIWRALIDNNDKRLIPYSLFVVEVFSVKEGKRLGYAWGKHPDRKKDEKVNLEWKNSLDSYSDSEKAQLRDSITLYVKQGIEEALTKLGY
jgi:hypothetical protein